MEANNSRSKFKRVCVFCGSNSGHRKVFSDAALDLGNELVSFFSNPLSFTIDCVIRLFLNVLVSVVSISRSRGRLIWRTVGEVLGLWVWYHRLYTMEAAMFLGRIDPNLGSFVCKNRMYYWFMFWCRIIPKALMPHEVYKLSLFLHFSVSKLITCLCKLCWMILIDFWTNCWGGKNSFGHAWAQSCNGSRIRCFYCSSW